jgi:hypothetical protein
MKAKGYARLVGGLLAGGTAIDRMPEYEIADRRHIRIALKPRSHLPLYA